MSIVKKPIERLLTYRCCRILMARSYPVLKRSGFISFFQKLNRGSFSDPYNHLDENSDAILRPYDTIKIDPGEALERYTVDPAVLVRAERSYNFGFISDFVNDLKDIRGACEAMNVNFTPYNIHDPDLIKKLRDSECDGIFICPAFVTVLTRTVFHEIAHIISTETSLRLYPTLRELNIYESKRTLAAFLEINGIPHAATTVFYDFDTAARFLETCSYPVVFKTHTGASASGVEILRDRNQAMKLARILFRKYYLRKLETEKRSIEWGYMIVQQYIEDVKEFRIIKVGDSWFGYQKWKEEHQEFLSGSGTARMIKPPSEILDFCLDIATRFSFTTMSFDIFVTREGKFLVNELQSWFGSYDPSEMYIDGVPGRYLRVEGKWVFEPGFFNVLGSNLLRIAHLISLLQEEKKVLEESPVDQI